MRIHKVMIFLVLLLSLSHSLRAQESTSPVTPVKQVAVKPPIKKHAVLMLAINYSEGEVNAARTAAKARGEEFIVIPELTPQVLSQAKYEYDQEIMEHRQLDPINMAMINTNDPKKSKVLEEKRAAILNAFSKAHPDSSHANNDINIRNEIRLKLAELQKKGVAVDSLVISSHDGGGNFFGTFGQTSKYEIANLTDPFPALKDTLKSVYMLGLVHDSL